MSDSQHRSVFHVSGFLLVTVLVAALAGTIASVFTQESLRQYIESLTGRESVGRLTTTQSRALPGTYEEALARVTSDALPSVVAIRQKTVDATSPSAWTEPTDVVIPGIIVTSDGWILASTDALSVWKHLGDDTEVWEGGRRYVVEEVVTDSLTHLTLVKISASNLPVIAFGKSSDVTTGQILFGLAPSTILATSVARVNAPSATVLPAEVYATQWLIQEDVGLFPLLNAAGELVAYGTAVQKAAPMEQILPFIQSVLREKAVVYAGLGVTVVDINAVANLPESVKMGKTDGALVVAQAGHASAFTKNSPAQAAGLKVNDLVTAVNNVPVTSANPLALLLKAYAPQDRVTLTVVRAGEKMDLSVTLGDYANLVY